MNLLQRLHIVHRAWRLRIRHDRHELLFLFRHGSPGQRVLDIGANKGAYTYWLSKTVGSTGEVIAFEPQPVLAHSIAEMSRDFGFHNVKVVNAALSSRSGTAILYQPESNSLGGATLHAPAELAKQLEVPVETLDSYFQDAEGAPVSLIKCDVEGHEFDVLQGGEKLLCRSRPALLFEWSAARPTAIFDYLRTLGYRGAYVFAHRQVFLFEDFERQSQATSTLANFGFLHESSSFWSRRQAA